MRRLEPVDGRAKIGGAMARDLTVILDDRPGQLAELGEVAGESGVNLRGLAAFTGDNERDDLFERYGELIGMTVTTDLKRAAKLVEKATRTALTD